MTDGIKLEPHHRNLASAIERLNCGLIGRDKGGTIVFANEILTRWLGYEPGELVGLPLEKPLRRLGRPPALDEAESREHGARGAHAEVVDQLLAEAPLRRRVDEEHALRIPLNAE